VRTGLPAGAKGIRTPGPTYDGDVSEDLIRPLGCTPSEEKSATARGRAIVRTPVHPTKSRVAPILDTDQRKAVPPIREVLAVQLSGSFRIRRPNKRWRMIPGRDFTLHHPKRRPCQ